MLSFNPQDFKIQGPVKLAQLPTQLNHDWPKAQRQAALAEVRTQLAEFQEKLFAHGKYGVLICFQGMDAAGKDSLIREVFKDFNARGIVVHSFKTPSTKELNHDYLWRHYAALPERGRFSVFNRSHYENLLVTRVYPEFILKENHPDIEEVADINPEFWQKRFRQINDFERHVSENGTIIIKFFLNLSYEEQRKRLLRRLEQPKHRWKFEPGDLKDRSNWTKFAACYEDILNHCSPDHAPWYALPADCKDTARYLAAKIILEHLQPYKTIQYPKLEPAIKARIDEFRNLLQKD